MSLSNKIKTAVMAGVLMLTGAGAALVPAYADDNAIINGTIQDGIDDVANQGGLVDQELSDVVKNIINIFLYIVGVLAVVMIIVGGVQYTTSAGDQAKVTKAKNTILYGIIGLVVALLAYAIINFVLKATNIS